jgi:hypothetical protein
MADQLRSGRQYRRLRRAVLSSEVLGKSSSMMSRAGRRSRRRFVCPTRQRDRPGSIRRSGQIDRPRRDVICFTEKARGRDDTAVRIRSDDGAPRLNPSTARHRVYHDMQADPPDLSLDGASHDPALKRELCSRASDIARP